MINRRAFALSLLIFLSACASTLDSKPKPAPEPISKYKDLQLFQSFTCKAIGKPTPFKRGPAYPINALKAGQQGWVIVEYDVEKGQPTNARSIASSPQGIFEPAAISFIISQFFPSKGNATNCRQSIVFNIES